MIMRARSSAKAWRPAAAVIAAALAWPTAAIANPIPESERWATITHAGNTGYAPPPIPPPMVPRPFGAVSYEYQISRTEVTTAEWYEFVLAYAPHIDPGSAGSFAFTGDRVIATQLPSGEVTYFMPPSNANKPVRIGWRYAARYCNWLHNGKASNPEAFEQGAYDTSTFTENPDGSLNDQRQRSPGAQYFIPSIDEWVKASYWDPNRDGLGQPGYWRHPNSSDTALVPGPPGTGQTNYGTTQTFESASYPAVQSPWGLWDVSGGVGEWLEDTTDSRGKLRYAKGSDAFSSYDFGGFQPPGYVDLIGRFRSSFADSSALFGLRVAQAVPAPASGVLMLGVLISASSHRRRRPW